MYREVAEPPLQLALPVGIMYFFHQSGLFLLSGFVVGIVHWATHSVLYDVFEIEKRPKPGPRYIPVDPRRLMLLIIPFGVIVTFLLGWALELVIYLGTFSVDVMNCLYGCSAVIYIVKTASTIRNFSTQTNIERVQA